MTNEEISFNTKKALSNALKKRVEQMPFDKIKVSYLINTSCSNGSLNLKQ